MDSMWTKDNKLTFGSLFDVAYPQSLGSHVTDLRNLQMGESEVNQVSSNVLEHPSLDLDSVFQTFRVSGSLSLNDIDPIKSFLAECQNDVKALESKIKDTISTISQLSRELTQTSARMVQKVSQTRLCEYLLSTPRYLPKYLPQDVLEEIFHACLATRDDPVPHPNVAPLQLAAVCHRWRAIALSMPVLWSDLLITSPSHVDLARTWLGRCDQPSLTISSKNKRVTPSIIQEFFDALDSLSLSLRTCDVRYLDGHLGNVMKKFILEHDQPALMELVVRELDGTLPTLPRPSTPLRRFYSQVIPQTWHPSSALTVLWLTPEIHSTTLPILLASFPNLESIYVALDQEGAEVDLNPDLSEDIILPRLHYCGIWECSKEAGPPEDLLQKFSFPSLRIVEYCQGNSSTPWFGLAHLLQSAHRFTLQSDEGNLSSEYFVHLLQHAPSLLELAISVEAQFMPDVITALTTMSLPTLQTLYLDISYTKLTKWLSFEHQLIEFGLAAWSAEGNTRSLRQLVIQYWHLKKWEDEIETEEDGDEGEGGDDQDDDERGEVEDRERLNVRQMVQSACPDLHVRIVARVTEDYWFWDVPILFEMAPHPSNSVLPHDVLDDDGSWRRKSGSVYQIV